MGGNATAALIGSLVGGGVAVILLSMVLEALIFRRLFDDPVMGKGFTVITAWILASTIWGFATARGGGFNTSGFFLYGIPALFVLFWYLVRGYRLRQMQDELSYDPEIIKPFE